MTLSRNAQALLDVLDIGGRAANPATLRRRLGWSDDQLGAAADEVCQAGLAEMQGRRLARVASGADVSPEAEMLLAALPADGSTVGGLRLRSALDLGNEPFARAKQELRAAGLIVLGVGRGERSPGRAPGPNPLVASVLRIWWEKRVTCTSHFLIGYARALPTSLGSP